MYVKFSNGEAVGVTTLREDLIWELWDNDLLDVGEEFVSEVRVFEDKIEADVLIPILVHYNDSFSFRKLRKEKKVFAWDDLLLMNKTLAKIFKKD